jgi:CheY-like chemotaxis protein
MNLALKGILLKMEKWQLKNFNLTPTILFLMDLQMPEMNGLGSNRLYSQKKTNSNSCIALTADVIGGLEKMCRAIGMNDHVAKPIDEKLL